MRIETVRPDEFPELLDVWEASVRATHDFLSEEDIEYFKPLILDEYFYLVDLRCVRGDDGKILGFSGVAEDKLEMLFLRPEARGNGLGKALLTYCVDHLGITKVDVNEQNPQALGFYLKMGFEIKSRSPVDSLGKPYPILHLELSGNDQR